MTLPCGEDLLNHPDTGPKLLDMLDSSTWAKDLSLEDIALLCNYLSSRRFKKGDIIFSEGDADDSMGIILDGSIGITKRSVNSSAKPLVTIGAGRAFGELALIEGPPRSATATARQNVILLVLTRPMFDKLCAEHKALALKVVVNIARLMSFRLRSTSEKLVEYL